ncbi:uncharacterized protein LOC118646565 [Monomorium pharaonis]|uniref:uncharacterized protein LOC118646565 n=1 Tax=Monomorium pharaonis TaxID=307658 RepID=UPI001745D7B3|nr:uncharacterized protein LOC118646565 [Monomorium pharaonis]
MTHFVFKNKKTQTKECRCNAREASRVYAERFPNRAHPHPQLFTRLHQRLRTQNRLTPEGSEGRPHEVTNIAAEEDILEQVEDDPTTSCRALEKAIGVSKSTINRIIRSNLFHPYHYTPVHKLHPGDAELRTQFCREFLALVYQHENFLINILWTDESLFTREGLFNQHNLHYYADENPFVTRVRNFQHRWKVNVWGGIVGNQILIYQLPDVLRGEQYATFLEEALPDLLDDVPLAARPRWFQQDGAPPHNIRRVREYLNAQFPGRWFGAGGPLRWPPRSPDLSPLDFFLWGYLKEKVYAKQPENVEEVVARLHAAVATVDAEMLLHVRNEAVRRAHACLEANGEQFEHTP